MVIIRKIYISFFLVLSSLILSCEEYLDWKLKADPERHLVVEAILTDELQTQELKLSQSYQDLNEEVPMVSDAEVKVAANGVVYNFIADPIKPGMYKSEEPFKVFADLIYNLEIAWKGINYTASSKLGAVAPIPTFSFQERDSTDSLSFTYYSVTRMYNASQQSMYEIDIDWSHLSNVEPVQAKMYVYTFSSIYIDQLILPNREVVLFPRGSNIYIKKYGLNDEFAEYLHAMNLEIAWNGNAFYGPSTNVPTNLSEGALGFFSTCAVLKDTIVAR